MSDRVWVCMPIAQVYCVMCFERLQLLSKVSHSVSFNC